MGKDNTTGKSSSAMYLLFAEGGFLLLMAAAVIACGFVLNYHDDFDYERIQAEIVYVQYWVGLVFLITAFFAVAAGLSQQSKKLIFSTMILFLGVILVSLFALVVMGNDWIRHKNTMRRKDFWESEDYNCQSQGTTSCICSIGNGGKDELISQTFDCSTVEKLSYIYGAIIVCILGGIFVALSSMVTVMILVPIRSQPGVESIQGVDEPDGTAIQQYRGEIAIRQQQAPRAIMEMDEIAMKDVIYRIPPTHSMMYEQPRPDQRTFRHSAPLPMIPREKLRLQERRYDVNKLRSTPEEESSRFVLNPNFENGSEPESRPFRHTESYPVHMEDGKHLRRREPSESVGKVRGRPAMGYEHHIQAISPAGSSYPGTGRMVEPHRPQTYRDTMTLPHHTIDYHGERVQRSQRSFSDEDLLRVYNGKVHRQHSEDHREPQAFPLRRGSVE